jgi:hypothetical protein
LGIGTTEPASTNKDEASAKPLVWPKPAQETIAAIVVDSPPADAGVSTVPEHQAAEPSSPVDEPSPLEIADTANTDSADSEAIDRLLKKSLAALQEQRFDDADRTLVQAGEEAGIAPSHGRLAHWQALANCARGFADYRNQALDAADSAREYEIDGKRLAVVEIDDEKIVYRFAGKNKTLPRSRIPDKLLLAILKGWLNRKPANQLHLGAYHATKPKPDLEKAREAWLLAERGGADASELLPLLDDPVLVKAAGGGQ